VTPTEVSSSRGAPRRKYYLGTPQERSQKRENGGRLGPASFAAYGIQLTADYELLLIAQLVVVIARK